MVDPNADDAAIAEFHAAARRRNVRIFTTAALLCIAIGVVILIVSITAAAGTDEPRAVSSTIGTRRFEGRVIVAGIAFVVAGFGLGWKAIQTKRGENV